MNDITALMATMKAAAERAIGAHERLSVMPSDGLFDASLAENTQLESDITALIAHNDESTPANVRALVEALEARDKQIADKNLELFKQSADIAELALSRKNAWKQASAARNGFDEQYALREGAEKRIASLESRTVTVKLPEEVLRFAQAPQHLNKHDQLCWMSGANWMRMEVVKLNPAAGIQVIEGEGQ